MQNKETASGELSTKTVKAVTQVKDAAWADTRRPLEINYEKAAAEAINIVKQDLATKGIEQRVSQELERQNMNETLSTTRPESTTGENFKRIMSIIPVGGHEVTRNLSEPSDQRLMHIDVYADYLKTISTQTPSRA